MMYILMQGTKIWIGRAYERHIVLRGQTQAFCSGITPVEMSGH